MDEQFPGVPANILLRIHYKDGRRQEVRFKEVWVDELNGTVRSITGLDERGHTYKHPAPETIARVEEEVVS